MPRPGCFQMPLSHGSVKASGNRAKRSWILNKPGFLSNIVEGPLSKPLSSHQIRKSQSRWGHWELWYAMSFRKLIFFKREDKNIFLKKLRLTYLEIIFGSWQWRRQHGVNLVVWPWACQLTSLDSISWTLMVNKQAVCWDLFSYLVLPDPQITFIR